MSNFDKSVDFLETNRYLEIMSKEKSRYLQKARSDMVYHFTKVLTFFTGFDGFAIEVMQNQSKSNIFLRYFRAFQVFYFVLFFETTRLRLQIDWFW